MTEEPHHQKIPEPETSRRRTILFLSTLDAQQVVWMLLAALPATDRHLQGVVGGEQSGQ